MLIHISGNYPYHTLFSEMIRSIHEMGVEQRIIVPLRNGKGEGINAISLPDVTLRYIDMYDNLDRALYFRKMRRGYKKLLREYPHWDSSDVMIAHTAFSDGGLAYKIHRQFGVPYVVCIRDTDVNCFLKYKPYLKHAFLQILLNAKRIVFLTPCYTERVLAYSPESSRDVLRKKFVSIPNGIHPFWFNHVADSVRAHHPLSILFVGELSKRKNILTTLKALRILQDKGMPFRFDIVGDGGQRGALEKESARLGIDQQVSFLGWKQKKEELLTAYQSADLFVMPSLRETFGTVYLEAMTQGLPCVYTRNEGIDGWFQDGEIGKAVSPLDESQIADAILYIRDHYEALSTRCLERVKEFQWNEIAKKYLEAAGIQLK